MFPNIKAAKRDRRLKTDTITFAYAKNLYT